MIYTIASIYWTDIFKDNLRTIEAKFPKKLRTTEAHFEFTGPYKKKSVCPNIGPLISELRVWRCYDYCDP